jgi:hypothetical protein
MYDSLKNDPSTGLSSSVIWSHINSTVLEVGLAYGNTYKHTIRNDPNQLTAYVGGRGKGRGSDSRRSSTGQRPGPLSTSKRSTWPSSATTPGGFSC